MANVKKVGEVFRCDICGNVVEVKEVGGGELVCCGQPMTAVKKAAKKKAAEKKVSAEKAAAKKAPAKKAAAKKAPAKKTPAK